MATQEADVQAYQQGVKLFREGRLLEALAMFRFAASTGVDRAMEHFALASAMVKVGDLQGAEVEYRRFLELSQGLEPQEAAARVALEQIRATKAETKAAPDQEAQALDAQRLAQERASESARRKEELDRYRLTFDEALAYYRVGGFDSCIQRLNTIIAGWGPTAELLSLLGLAQLGAREYDLALATLTEAYERSEFKATAATNLARAEYERGCARAAELLEEAVQETPPQGAWYNLGVVYEAQGNFGAAQRCYQSAVDTDPEDIQAKANLEHVARRML